MERKKETGAKAEVGDRRDFLRKMALGTAYAIPVMTTFSLDSVRSKAFAQGNYGNPRVVRLRAQPASNLGNFAAPAALQDIMTPTIHWVIDFDRPMDKRYNGAKYLNEYGFSCNENAVAGPACKDVSDAGKCTDYGWKFNSDGTKEISPGFTRQPGMGMHIDAALNLPGCGNTPYQDLNGVKLDPYSGCANYCEPDPT